MRSSSGTNVDASGRCWIVWRTELAANTGVVGSIGSCGCGAVVDSGSHTTREQDIQFTGPGGNLVNELRDNRQEWTINSLIDWFRERGV